MIETKIQTEDLATRLNDAVLRAAMPDPEFQFPTLADAHNEQGEKNLEKTRVGDGSAGPGRPRNVKNRLTNLREAVLEAFEMVGGAQYLAKLAAGTSSDRAAFVGLVAKVLPTQINANVEGGIQVQLSWLGARNIGQTQVVDLEKQINGKYEIVDRLDTVVAEPSIDAPCEAEGGQSTHKSTHNGGPVDAGGELAGKGAGDAQGV